MYFAGKQVGEGRKEKIRAFFKYLFYIAGPLCFPPGHPTPASSIAGQK
jgi:hypothetical protein